MYKSKVTKSFNKWWLDYTPKGLPIHKFNGLQIVTNPLKLRVYHHSNMCAIPIELI